MTRQCILHIGMNKTGTTSVQSCFDAFDDGRLRYADLVRANHSRPLQMMFGARWRLVPENELPVPQFSGLVRGDLFARLDADLADRSRDMLFSAEEVSNAFSASDVTRFLDYLRPHFDRIVALAYLREPLDFMRSVWQQRLRDQFTPPDANLLYPNYRRRFVSWVDQLGAHLSLHLFDRQVLRGGETVTDLAARIGVAAPNTGARSANSSLSADAFALVYAFRRAQNAAGIAAAPMLERPAVAALMNMAAPRFAVEPGLWGDILEREAEDIAWAEKQMGRAFPKPRAAGEDMVTFSSEADILDHAATVRERTRAWARWRVFPFGARARTLSRLIDCTPG